MRTFGHRSRTPHGVRELKLLSLLLAPHHNSRTPHGVRELKRIAVILRTAIQQSHPTRGA